MASIPSDAIAVVGMSGRFPRSDNLAKLWQLLEKGATTHQEIPPSRFCVSDFYDPSRDTHNTLFACHGCFIKEPGDFDHRLFNISPLEALQMDPYAAHAVNDNIRGAGDVRLCSESLYERLCAHTATNCNIFRPDNG